MSNHKLFYSATGVIIAVVLLFVVNIVGGQLLKSVRLDMTENGLYTLTDGSKNIVSSVESPLTLEFVFSKEAFKDLPAIATYANRIEELLVEYAALSRGKLTLEVIDPEPFSDQEDKAVEAGLQGVPANNAGDLGYFGLIASDEGGRQQVITFFQPNKEEFLEYDITKLIYNLVNPEKIKIALYSAALPVFGATNSITGQSSAPWTSLLQMRELYNVEELAFGFTEIAEDTDILMVLHPKGFTEPMIYAIDQFVLKGGRLVMVVDPFSDMEVPLMDPFNRNALPEPKEGSHINSLFDHWGVELVENRVVADRYNAMKVRSNEGPIDYVLWHGLRDAYFNQEDVVTQGLGFINLATPGSIRKKEGAEVDLIPLIQSSDYTMLMDVDDIQLDPEPPTPREILEKFQPEGVVHTLAARITGKMTAMFPQGKPVERSDDEHGGEEENNDEAVEEEHESKYDYVEDEHFVAESKGPVNIIMLADSDIFHDRFWARVQDFYGEKVIMPFADNLTLLTNIIDNLSGSSDLISVRSRGAYARPFEVVRDLQRAAEEKFMMKEQELQQELKQTEEKLNELASQSVGEGATVLTDEQQAEIDQFRKRKIEIRRDLRDVQHDLRKDIERLESRLQFVNIGLVPLLIMSLALVLGIRRARKLH